jgi:hypothetical protein
MDGILAVDSAGRPGVGFIPDQFYTGAERCRKLQQFPVER